MLTGERKESIRVRMPPCRILVVEDFELFRRVICSILRRRSEFQIVGEASDGLEAIHVSERLQPDLILLDIGLPRLSGLKAARLIRDAAPGARILFVSQERSSDVVQECLRSGALGYVQKMRTECDLLPAIDAVLRGMEFVSDGLLSEAVTDKPAHQRHEILFCGDEEALLHGLTQFIAAALSAGNAAIVWATESHREIIAQRLRVQGVDLDAAFRQQTYVASDVSEKADHTRLLQVLRRLSEAASQAGKRHPRVAVCGERAGRLWAEGKVDEALRLERLCNELARSQSMDILCAYPLPVGPEDDAELKGISAEHTAVQVP
jgi:DNA-binding NarL/FixJ family response regulator